ncbi:MAG: hypothetical protein KC619_33260, partial [Myxococcales bacterium]|nr:hypothetical protein [Myxococcales bacterium]
MELSNALGQYADGCGDPQWAGPSERRRLRECSMRLEGTSYATHAVRHLASDTMHLAELLEREAQAAALTADALSPGEAETPQAYVDAFWGPGGARFDAAEALMGTLPPDAALARVSPTYTFYFPDAFDAVIADRVARDERVAVAMRLLVEHGVPFAISREGVNRVPFPGLEASPEPFYNLLDHRLAFAARTPPYDLGQVTDAEWLSPDDVVPLPPAPPEVESHTPMTAAEFAAYASHPLALDDSPLRHFYGIEPVHVREALAMMRNLLDTMEVEYRLHEQVTGTPTLFAVELLSYRQADPRFLAATMQNVGTATTAVYADPVATLPGHGETSGQIYSYDPTLVPQLGAGVALHVVRVNLGRLASNPRSRAWLADASDVLPEAQQLVTSYVGDVWVEYLRHGDYVCSGLICPGPSPLCSSIDTGGFLCPEGDGTDATGLVGA